MPKYVGCGEGNSQHFILILEKGCARLCLLSHVQLFVTPWTAACQVSLSITNSRKVPTSRTSKKKNKINQKQVDGRSK